ncbi:MAG: phosphonate ABC transporter ATP-binding protein [Pseudomonadota bacterium]
MASIIAINGVSKCFVGRNKVLDGITIDIRRGEMVALIGASGSGKSTLIRLIAGLERVDRDGGEIALFGETVQRGGRRLSAQRRLRRDVGVVFQQFNLVGRLTLMRNVLAGRLGRAPAWRGLFGLFARQDRVKALSCIERVGMIAFARRRASQLSGGQQQRGAIARALCQEARIILADEPIASLDPATAERVMEILAEINRADACTVLVSLHQIDHAFRHCDRIIALKDGRVVFDGPTRDVKPEDLSALYGLEQSEAAGELNGTRHAAERGDAGDRDAMLAAAVEHEARRAAAGRASADMSDTTTDRRSP